MFYHYLLQIKKLYLWSLGGIQQKKKMEPVSYTVALSNVRVYLSLLDTSAIGNMGIGLEEVQIVGFFSFLNITDTLPNCSALILYCGTA